MGRHAGVIGYLKKDAGIDAGNTGVDIAGAIIGILAYILLVVPLVSLAAVDLLQLGSDYFVPVAIALVVAGIYIIEKFACRNIR